MNLAGGLGTPEAAAGRASGRRDAPSRVGGTTTVRSGSARACGCDRDPGTLPSPIADREKAAARFSVIPRLQAHLPMRARDRSDAQTFEPVWLVTGAQPGCSGASHARARGRTHPTRPPTTDPDTSARSNRAAPSRLGPVGAVRRSAHAKRGSRAPGAERQSHHGDAGGCDAGGGA